MKKKCLHAIFCLFLFALLCSGTSSATIAAAKKPSIPKILSIKQTAKNAITVQWEKAKNAKKYEVFMASPGHSFKKVKTTKALNYTGKKLVLGKKYRFKVRAVNGKKKSAFSLVAVMAIPKPNTRITLKPKTITCKPNQWAWIDVGCDRGAAMAFQVSSYLCEGKWGKWFGKNHCWLRVKSPDSGHYTVTVFDAANKTVRASLKLTVIQPVTKVIIESEDGKIDLGPGETETLFYDTEPYDADDTKLKWISSNPSVAKVKNGKVTALKKGTARITGTAASGVKGSVLVVVHDVTVSTPSLPITINTYDYDDNLQSACSITGISFESTYFKYDDDLSVKMWIQGKKTYDQEPSISSECEVGYKLYDSNGIVIESGTFYSDSVLPGEKFRGYTYLGTDMKEGTYRLVLMDVT